MGQYEHPRNKKIALTESEKNKGVMAQTSAQEDTGTL
jgi:hypothetical protein